MNQDMAPAVIDVWPDEVPDNDLWRGNGPERDTVSPSGTRIIRNVSTPTLTAYLPDPDMTTGTCVIVCPGGAFPYLSIDKEVSDVARWLTAWHRGLRACVPRRAHAR